MTYVDGFVCPVPKGNQEAYLKSAKIAAELFRECGALSVFENWGDDVPDGKVTDFKRAVQATADEVVVFSWVVWPSKGVRDAGWARMMDDERMKGMDMPFDGKRMIYGGFANILDA